jgi:hypothetical protein
MLTHDYQDLVCRLDAGELDTDAFLTAVDARVAVLMPRTAVVTSGH